MRIGRLFLIICTGLRVFAQHSHAPANPAVPNEFIVRVAPAQARQPEATILKSWVASARPRMRGATTAASAAEPRFEIVSERVIAPGLHAIRVRPLDARSAPVSREEVQRL